VESKLSSVLGVSPFVPNVRSLTCMPMIKYKLLLFSGATGNESVTDLVGHNTEQMCKTQINISLV